MDRNKKTAVFGIYPSLEAANSATDVLVKSGFPSSDISALLPDNLGSRPIATEKSTKAPEGAAAGGGSGAVVGGAIGLLAGIGALAIPSRPSHRSRTDHGHSHRSAHQRSGRRSRRSIEDRTGHPRIRSEALRKPLEQGGFCMLSVHCNTADEIHRAKNLMDGTGAEDISSTGEATVSTSAKTRSAKP